MVVKNFQLGPLGTNCYLCIVNSEVWVIDPGFEGEKIVSYCQNNNLAIEGIILTHYHWDHVLGIPPIIEMNPKIPLYVHKNDSNSIGGEKNLLLSRLALAVDSSLQDRFIKMWEALPKASVLLQDGDFIKKCDFKVIHTPGHSSGSICLYNAKSGILFSGDTLFHSSIGRVDLPGGDAKAILPSIKSKLMVLPSETVVYPGHGEPTTIGNEAKNNPYLI
ncbi:MAG: MBL fold metallo-hydrolase [Sphaerochaetaceae bacterium]